MSESSDKKIRSGAGAPRQDAAGFMEDMAGKALGSIMDTFEGGSRAKMISGSREFSEAVERGVARNLVKEGGIGLFLYSSIPSLERGLSHMLGKFGEKFFPVVMIPEDLKDSPKGLGQFTGEEVASVLARREDVQADKNAIERMRNLLKKAEFDSAISSSAQELAKTIRTGALRPAAPGDSVADKTMPIVKDGGRIMIFATHSQVAQVVALAAILRLPAFSLMVVEDAHGCAGRFTNDEPIKNFLRLHGVRKNELMERMRLTKYLNGEGEDPLEIDVDDAKGVKGGKPARKSTRPYRRRTSEEILQEEAAKRPRGRPRGSKNRTAAQKEWEKFMSSGGLESDAREYFEDPRIAQLWDFETEDKNSDGVNMLRAMKRLYVTATPDVMLDSIFHRNLSPMGEFIFSFHDKEIFGPLAFKLDMGDLEAAGVAREVELVVPVIDREMAEKISAEVVALLKKHGTAETPWRAKVKKEDEAKLLGEMFLFQLVMRKTRLDLPAREAHLAAVLEAGDMGKAEMLSQMNLAVADYVNTMFPASNGGNIALRNVDAYMGDDRKSHLAWYLGKDGGSRDEKEVRVLVDARSLGNDPELDPRFCDLMYISGEPAPYHDFVDSLAWCNGSRSFLLECSKESLAGAADPSDDAGKAKSRDWGFGFRATSLPNAPLYENSSLGGNGGTTMEGDARDPNQPHRVAKIVVPVVLEKSFEEFGKSLYGKKTLAPHELEREALLNFDKVERTLRALRERDPRFASDEFRKSRTRFLNFDAGESFAKDVKSWFAKAMRSKEAGFALQAGADGASIASSSTQLPFGGRISFAADGAAMGDPHFSSGGTQAGSIQGEGGNFIAELERSSIEAIRQAEQNSSSPIRILSRMEEDLMRAVDKSWFKEDLNPLKAGAMLANVLHHLRACVLSMMDPLERKYFEKSNCDELLEVFDERDPDKPRKRRGRPPKDPELALKREREEATKRRLEKEMVSLLVGRGEADKAKVAKLLKELLWIGRRNIDDAMDLEEIVRMVCEEMITDALREAIFGPEEPQNIEEPHPDEDPLHVVAARGAYAELAPELAKDGGVSQAMELVEDIARNLAPRADYARSLEDAMAMVDFVEMLVYEFSPEDNKSLYLEMETPQKIVDFMVQSSADLVREHLGMDIDDPEVALFEPFGVAGEFFSRLFETGVISRHKLAGRPGSLRTNDRSNVSRNLARLRIAKAIAASMDDGSGAGLDVAPGEPGRGLGIPTFGKAIIANSFNEADDLEYLIAKGEEDDMLQSGQKSPRGQQGEEETWERDYRLSLERRQREAAPPRVFGDFPKAHVLIGNPEYAYWRYRDNDGEMDYFPALYERSRRTYKPLMTRHSTLDLFAPDKLAVRYASDRIGDCGVVALLVGGDFLTKVGDSGFRASLEKEFDHVYIVNLRGGEGGELKARSDLPGKEAPVLNEDGENVLWDKGRNHAILFLVKEAPGTRERVSIDRDFFKELEASGASSKKSESGGSVKIGGAGKEAGGDSIEATQLSFFDVFDNEVMQASVKETGGNFDSMESFRGSSIYMRSGSEIEGAAVPYLTKVARKGVVKYHDLGTYLRKEEKLSLLEDLGSVANIQWAPLELDANGDWFNKRSATYGKYLALVKERKLAYLLGGKGENDESKRANAGGDDANFGEGSNEAAGSNQESAQHQSQLASQSRDGESQGKLIQSFPYHSAGGKSRLENDIALWTNAQATLPENREDAIFQSSAIGVDGGIDEFGAGFSRRDIWSQMKRFCTLYNREAKVYRKEGDAIFENESDEMVWNIALRERAERSEAINFDKRDVVESLHAPFYPTRFFFDEALLNRSGGMASIYPERGFPNIHICTDGEGGSYPYMADRIVTGSFKDHECLPFYRYDRVVGEAKFGQGGSQGVSTGIEEVVAGSTQRVIKEEEPDTLTNGQRRPGRPPIYKRRGGRIEKTSTREFRNEFQGSPIVLGELGQSKVPDPMDFMNAFFGEGEAFMGEGDSRVSLDFGSDEAILMGEFVRRDAISGDSLLRFKNAYPKIRMSKRRIFFYIFGVMHSKAYIEDFESNLSSQIPRIPFFQEFETYEKVGREIARLQVGFESLAPNPAIGIVVKDDAGGETAMSFNEILAKCSDKDFYASLDLENKTFLIKDPDGKVLSGEDIEKLDGKDLERDGYCFEISKRMSIRGISGRSFAYRLNGRKAVGWLAEDGGFDFIKDGKWMIQSEPLNELGDPLHILRLAINVFDFSRRIMEEIDSLPKKANYQG